MYCTKQHTGGGQVQQQPNGSNAVNAIIKAIIAVLVLFSTVSSKAQLPLLKISDNKHFFQTEEGKPFFWLGDTGWLLFVKCNREDAIKYLDTRKQQGFNVVQVMVIHDVTNVNAYGDSTLINQNVATPNVTPGNDFNDPKQYDFWDHMEFIIQEADKRGLYMGLVPVWGHNVKGGKVTVSDAKTYAKFLTERFSKYSNIVWLNGGDLKGSEGYDVWQAIAHTIKTYDKKHLMTFHPRGRFTSSDWFQNDDWMDFNMVQSGHRTYEQDTTKADKHFFGEDNWRYIKLDYNLRPAKPVIDGEPSYENIPYGLHDYTKPRWNAADLRRYAYWSVFAGGAGFTYGENSVMQFHTPGDKDANYDVKLNWKEAINAPGAKQMQYLKKLMLAHSYFDRVPAQEIIVDNKQKRYNYILATKSNSYAMAYTYTGRSFKVNTKKLRFKLQKAAWFNPSTGETTAINLVKIKGKVLFNPPGEPKNGNDWVLVLEK
ncbi:MAG: glycoside hydrolase family 140 protein [Niabella sp.]